MWQMLDFYSLCKLSAMGCKDEKESPYSQWSCSQACKQVIAVKKDAYFDRYGQIINSHKNRAIDLCGELFHGPVVIEKSLEEWLDALWVVMREGNAKHREQHLQIWVHEPAWHIKKTMAKVWVYLRGRENECRGKKHFEYHV